MMYLVDTNIWLEQLLDQRRSTEVGQFLARTPTDQADVLSAEREPES